MKNRIEKIEEEMRLLFTKNNMEFGLIHSTYIDYIKSKKPNGYKPYIDSRVRFNGIRKLNRLMKEYEKIKKLSIK